MSEILQRYPVIIKAIPPVFILWTLLMLALTLLPADSIPDSRLFSFDKIGHFAMFGGWTFFLGLYIIAYKRKTDANLFLLMLAGILFGGSIEIMQHLLPGNRSASWGDFTANTLGCIVAYLILSPLRQYLKRKN